MIEFSFRGVTTAPYGDGKRYIFPHSFLVIAEPDSVNKENILMVSLSCKQNPDNNLCAHKNFDKYHKYNGKIQIDKTQLNELLNIVFRMDFNWQNRN